MAHKTERHEQQTKMNENSAPLKSYVNEQRSSAFLLATSQTVLSASAGSQIMLV